MSKQSTSYSLHKVYIAPIGDDGATGTIWTDLTQYYVADGSVNIANDAPEETTINHLEDVNKPFMRILTQIPDRIFNFALRVPDPALRVMLLGGSIGTNGEYIAPAKPMGSTSWSLKFITSAVAEDGIHNEYIWPLVKLVAFHNGNLDPSETLLFNITCTQQTPVTDAGVELSPEQVYLKPAAPISTTGDDTADTLLFDPAEPFAATDHEYTTDGGSTWTDVTVNPITGLSGAYAAADVQVRVKAVADQWSAGYEKQSNIAFTV